jgi:peptidoglycan/LPS O-acetylase OafA/YrhL
VKPITPRRYEYIDALRGFAILGVVLFHCRWIPPSSYTLMEIVLQGAKGVQLFFLASALTLFLSLEARKPHEKRPTTNFFIRRFFRVAPLFYLAIIVYSLHGGMGPRFWAPDGIRWWYIPLTATFLHGWDAKTITSVVPGGWTIAVEMTFYLFVPYLFTKLTNIRTTLMALLVSLVVARLSSMIVLHHLGPKYPGSLYPLLEYFTYFWFPSQFPIFLMGILLYHLVKRHPVQDRRISVTLLLASGVLFGWTLTVGVLPSLIPQLYPYGIALLLFALSLHFFPHALLVNRITTWIGKLSYSIYLTHFLVISIMKSVVADGFLPDGNIGFFLVSLLVLIFSTAISYLTHRWIETPGIHLGKKLVDRL